LFAEKLLSTGLIFKQKDLNCREELHLPEGAVSVMNQRGPKCSDLEFLEGQVRECLYVHRFGQASFKFF
jgi:hypothetical protein